MAQPHNEETFEPDRGPDTRGWRSTGRDRRDDGGHRPHGGHHHHHGHPEGRWAEPMGGWSGGGRGRRGRGGRPLPDDVRAFGARRRFGADDAREGRQDEGRKALWALISAVRQVSVVGDEPQRESARVILDQAARAIWSILAQGPAVETSERKDPLAGVATADEGDPTATLAEEPGGSPDAATQL